MEQKQLDEIDDSYFGEEFIDEDQVSEEEVIIENVKGKKEKKPAIKAKKVKTKNAKVSSSKEPVVEIIKEEQEQSKPSVKEPVEITSPIDPWKEETSPAEGNSTWKAIAAIAVILLLASVFTQGFHFSNAAEEVEISLGEAENTALNYVNTYLLQPPFAAEIASSAEVDDLYKITLTVAGENVDSYLTKDGKLFFPQGFEVVAPLVLEDSAADLQETPAELPPASEDPVTEETAEEVQEEVTEESAPSASEDVAEPTVETVGSEEDTQEDTQNETQEDLTPPAEPQAAPEEVPTKEVTLTAKRWLFNPQQIVVSQGTRVIITIVPENIKFTFALPAFNVEQAVQEATTVEFVANQKGTFDFTCASCEEWRGMKGTVKVE